MSDSHYLKRCADLAKLGDGRVKDNPRVGAVLVHEGRIIGEGYHRMAGQAHAEVNCLASVAEEDRALVPDSTLYISLEPCCITGRTGACTDLIRREGIRTVVFAQRDTTPGVDGQSVEILRSAGITVREYPDFEPTLTANAHRHILTTLGRPRIVLKYAQSADGFLRPADRQLSYWITNKISRRLVHRWRANTMAILVGGRTVTDDNPSLSTRYFPGPTPRPVVIDPRDRITGKEQLFDGTGERTLLFSGKPRPGVDADNTVIGSELNKAALTQVLSKLKEQRIGEVTVEGGASVLKAFVSAGLWDEARVFTGSVRFGEGVRVPVLPPSAVLVEEEEILADRLAVYHNSKVEHRQP
ncbi:bifunctional diaminohydroxyphosphoribosylaminopyrimidine deaminase/5-amino-6-(5-phosphoribosylamino)uracil reductase RibD [Neolewinella aurantiaca]|uniref:Riboflavin biosynthesis protein RibD n=1 Tax=Neolewinella aurantiaca TaxID=2602767 RepID=A0A5C7FXM8_9BACT|nr:bifunctional diaminohydroxyphosphoribosylaminopyrimidine deaminase/5-amino-6-(5-phosphoribosylamino)uracil reductase RibD [Neolewinella aurantiaca]TXF91538.1 bifunctional diaminohydroxyphosphoribosylaminopyrimidine deaminase/5-amino-6-(5-phosphoribosylamino)uracil reductase RibD [Neolewinella aurantiaca]